MDYRYISTTLWRVLKVLWYLHNFYLLSIMARMVRMFGMWWGKIMRRFVSESLPRLIHQWGWWQRPLTPDACCYNYSLCWTVTHPSGGSALCLTSKIARIRDARRTATCGFASKCSRNYISRLWCYNGEIIDARTNFSLSDFPMPPIKLPKRSSSLSFVNDVVERVGIVLSLMTLARAN